MVSPPRIIWVGSLTTGLKTQGDTRTFIRPEETGTKVLSDECEKQLYRPSHRLWWHFSVKPRSQG